jgi:hypothetical protein
VIAGVLAVAALLFAGGVAVLLLRPADDSGAVPFQHLWVDFTDEGGTATIRSDAFRVAFEGHSFGSTKGGNYVVDGRYGWRLFHGPEGTNSDLGNGVRLSYSQRQRRFTMRYQGHEVVYSHAGQTITVDGREFSTAGRPARLQVGADGTMRAAGEAAGARRE